LVISFIACPTSSDTKTAGDVSADGWTLVLSGLKTLLETGQPLVIAPPGA
jgi:hypothetical protein